MGSDRIASLCRIFARDALPPGGTVAWRRRWTGATPAQFTVASSTNTASLEGDVAARFCDSALSCADLLGEFPAEIGQKGETDHGLTFLYDPIASPPLDSFHI